MSTTNVVEKLTNVLEYITNTVTATARRKLIFKFISGFAGVLSFRYAYWRLHRKYNKYPPGPIGLPYFGSFFNCVDLASFSSYLLSRYGGITMIYVGFQPYVFLHTISAINCVYSNNNAHDRDWDKSLVFNYVSPPEIMLAFSPKKYWKTKRKDFQSILLSKLDSKFVNNVHNKSLNSHIFGVIDNCIKNDKLWSYHNEIKYLAFNFIWYTSFGYFLDYNSHEEESFWKVMDESTAELSWDVILRYLGIYNVFHPEYSSLKRFGDYIEETIYKIKYDDNNCYDSSVWDFNNTKWNKHFMDIQNNPQASTALKFIAYHRMKYLNKNYDPRLTICGEIVQLFGAGVATTIDAIEYGLTALAKYQNIQDLIYKEVFGIFHDDVSCVKVLIKDVVHKLHYLRAFLHELLRIASILPIGVPRYTRNNNILCDSYVIPAGSIIIGDFANASRNDKYWINKKNELNDYDIMNFNINLWLDNNNKFRHDINKNKFVSFGVGARNCVGQALAKRSLYLLFIKFILKYKFKIPNDNNDIKIKQSFNFGWSLNPKIDLKVEHRM